VIKLLLMKFSPTLCHSPAYSCFSLPLWLGRAIAQAVSLWLPTAAARVRARSGHVGFVVDKTAREQVFSEYFGLPCKLSFHQILHPHSHRYNIGQLVGEVPSGLS
jgi:hypothetical protein